MPSRLPDISGKTSAAQIVRAFERVVVLHVDKGEGAVREELFSPVRLWTEVRRKASPLDKGQSTRLSSLCRIYVYIRVCLKVAPDAIEKPFGQLRSEAGAWAKGEGKDEAAEWYERAVAEYQRLASEE